MKLTDTQRTRCTKLTFTSCEEATEQLLPSLISKVDLRGLEPGGPGWAEARTAVAASMEELGVVFVVHDAFGPTYVGPWSAAPSRSSALPMNVKQGLVSGTTTNGYIGLRPQAPTYHNVRIWEITDGGRVWNMGDVYCPHSIFSGG
ncbi:hypothetical protein PR202_gb03279 [Eleusine coracana subsp. coracana]|uniref:Uncharacterized protein n=1 Tax=Eleusine coracana subsp. coracana TaxID=191504 RepID=A0AAV5E1E4_ELECO|nr:hypothetical protein PR202_gb03198 [Eleusine coracana subsp. coracana]GJN16305.1 hypothetical protein PR202_gb03279 [Eleusine coracana subsp. coracana]